MPPVRNISPRTGLPTPDHYIHTTSARFVDSHGRSLLLRGVNLSGSTKAPVNRPSQSLEGFWDIAEAGGESFIGRPLNLDDGSADIHLARLRGWGFNMLRYVVTWEALEHQGPGLYDYEFMDYTVRVLQRCKAFGFKVYMDPHQDLWSRFSGGSGAPFWTLAACGLEPRNFTKTEATLVHCEYPSAEEPDPATFPSMIWNTNYYRLAVFTVFTFFFGGRDFAPKCVIDGVNIQDYLQGHFIEAMGKLADRIREAGDLLEECVIGWDSINEPSGGLLGHENINEFFSDQAMKRGTRPTPAQALRLGMGIPQTVEMWGFNAFGPVKQGEALVDPKGVKSWLDPSDEPNCKNTRWGWTRSKEWKMGTCPWALHDVWDPESGYILIPDYFKSSPDTNRPIEFIVDYWKPHWLLWEKRIRAAHPDCIHFVHPPVFVIPPKFSDKELGGRACYSPHYYDGLTLVTRHWNWFNADALGVLRGRYKSPILAVKIGETAIRKSLQEQLGEYLEDVKVSLGPQYPTMIGEIGTPMDLDAKRSYGLNDDGRHKGDYSQQQKALDASMNASDGPNSLNWTIWTYCPDNNHLWGEGWNLEDLSLWSSDDLTGNIPTNFQMGSTAIPGNNEAIDGRSNAQLLLSRTSSSIEVDRMRVEDGGGPFQDPAYTLANPSAYSVATFGDPAPEGNHASSNARQFPHRSSNRTTKAPISMFPSGGHDKNLWHFLTNGARAVGAFVRPWPIAVVGTTTDIQFNIAKAEFKLSIKVSTDDIRQSMPSGSSITSTPADRRESEKDDVLPTEIFIPLVHYAEDPFAPRPRSQRRFRPRKMSQSSDTSSPNSPTTPTFRRHNSPQLSQPPQIPEQHFDAVFTSGLEPSPARSQHFPRTGTDTSGRTAAATLSSPVTRTNNPIEEDDEIWRDWEAHDVALSLDVQASEGSRWEVEGQVLRWWYPGPSSSELEACGSSEKPSGEVEVDRWIRVRRRGGAIKGIGTLNISVDEEPSMWDWCPRWCC